jgi:hypothetical protein
MSKYWPRLIGTPILLFVLIFVGAFVYDNHLYEEENSSLNDPNLMSSYLDTGYYKIDPRTILVSLENGDPHVFTPLWSDQAFALEQITDISINWTLTDFLKIASAIGQFAWGDPMDLDDWSVYSIGLEGNCGDHVGFYSADITYFKRDEYGYVTRLIEIPPYLGWVRWGDGNRYRQPILHKWQGIDLARAKIIMDNTLRKANEDATRSFAVRKDACRVSVYSSRFDPENWHLNISGEEIGQGSPFP